MVMKKFMLLVAVTGVALVAIFGLDGVRNATSDVVRAGQGAFDAGRDAVAAGQGAVTQVRNTAAVVGQLNTACDLVRTAVRPETPADQSAGLLRQAVGIVDAVVTTYPDVPGVSDLHGAVGTAQVALATDPSGQVLKANPGAIESACSRIPPLP